MTRQKATIFVLLVTILVLSTVRLYLIVHYAVLNDEYMVLREELSRQKEENDELHQAVLRGQALTEIEKKASVSGFIKPSIYSIR